MLTKVGTIGGILCNQRVLLPGRENQRGAYELAVRRYIDGEAFLTSESVDRLEARAKARGSGDWPRR